MDCKLCNGENTNYNCIMCEHPVCNVCSMHVEES